jgi:predicted phosphodiesterase
MSNGNLPALDAVLAEVDRADVDAIVVGGDLVWGPMPGETLDRLVALGERARFVMGNADGLGDTLFCHGSPRSDTERITTATPDARLRRIVEGVGQSIVVCGHTHRQFDRRIDGWRVVNAGAVGLPYEGRAAAFWAVVGPQVELRCTDYDVDEALKVFRAAGMTDEVEQEMRLSLFEPADPDEVADYFESRVEPGG